MAAARWWQFVREDGEVVLPGPYELAHSFRDGVANVRVSGKWGLIDREGRFVAPAQYAMVRPSYQGRAAFQQGDKWGWLDAAGHVAIEPRFDTVGDFDVPGVPLAPFSVSDKWGVLRVDGSIGLPAERYGVSVGRDGWIRVENGFIDEGGKQVIRSDFSWAANFEDDRALVKVDGKCGFLDRRGELVIAPTFDSGESFSEGLACMLKDGKYGFIDVEGKTVVPFEYVGATRFSGGRAFVWRAATAALLIDKTSARIASPELGDAEAFDRGTAVVARLHDGPFGLLDMDGKLVLPMQYASIAAVTGTHRNVSRPTSCGVLHGYVDQAGKVTCEPKFVDAKPLIEGLAAVEATIMTAPIRVVVHEPPVVSDDTPRRLLTKRQIRARLWGRRELVDQVLDVAKNRAAVRKLVRSADLYDVRASAFHWLDALGVDAVRVLEPAIEGLRDQDELPSWRREKTEALEECTAALDAIDSWDSACARARLFADFPSPERHLGRVLRAYALVVSTGGAKRDEAARAFARLEGEHPGAVVTLLETLSGDEESSVRALATVYGIGLPEATGDEMPRRFDPPLESA